ncbi:MAG: hypothetical protein ACYC1Q_14090 [Bacteroidia bacterium]
MKIGIGKFIWAFALLILIISIFFEKDLPPSLQHYWWIIVAMAFGGILVLEIIRKFK